MLQKNKTMKVAVMASGRGSNFQAIIDSSERGEMPNAQIVHLIADNKDAYAIQRASKHKIDYTVIESKKYSREDFEIQTLKVLQNKKVDVIVLAGFMRILTSKFINSYKNKIINIHPSLLPSFPGAHAHRDTISYGAKISGCTVHLVDEGVDTGPIIMQASLQVDENETEETLSQKILPLEHELLPRALELFCSKKLKIDGRNVSIITD